MLDELTETTYFRFHGKTNNINLDYKLELNKLSKYKLTSISTTETNIQADTTGGSATHGEHGHLMETRVSSMNRFRMI